MFVGVRASVGGRASVDVPSVPAYGSASGEYARGVRWGGVRRGSTLGESPLVKLIGIGRL